jgi:CheY-like chemotaxis protein
LAVIGDVTGRVGSRRPQRQDYRPRILYAEDEAFVRLIVEEQLAEAGFEVVSAASAARRDRSHGIPEILTAWRAGRLTCQIATYDTQPISHFGSGAPSAILGVGTKFGFGKAA